MSTLSLITSILAFDDEGATSNPSQRIPDWKRSILNVPVDSSAVERKTIEPMGSAVIFDGTRSTAIDGTSQFSLAASPVEASRYRLTHTGGTAPAFRTDRALALNGLAVTITIGLNLSAVVTVDSGTPFGAVQVGDIVFLPGVSTGDSASPFNTLNLGYWTVVSASAASITMVRAAGAVFEGLTETVTVTNNAQFQAFSSTGVQVGDTLSLLAGFATPALGSHEIVAVNPKWIEFISTSALGAQSGVTPGVNGVLVYTDAKKFVYVEVDQRTVIRVNGDTSNHNNIEPWVPGDRNLIGDWRKTGTTYRLEIINKSTAKLSAFIIAIVE